MSLCCANYCAAACDRLPSQLSSIYDVISRVTHHSCTYRTDSCTYRTYSCTYRTYSCTYRTYSCIVPILALVLQPR